MLGALPQAVIDGTLRAAHAPDVRPVANTSSALLDDVDDPALDDPMEEEPMRLEGKRG
jgi:hypothetical protein